MRKLASSYSFISVSRRRLVVYTRYANGRLVASRKLVYAIYWIDCHKAWYRYRYSTLDMRIRWNGWRYRKKKLGSIQSFSWRVKTEILAERRLLMLLRFALVTCKNVDYAPCVPTPFWLLRYTPRYQIKGLFV